MITIWVIDLLAAAVASIAFLAASRRSKHALHGSHQYAAPGHEPEIGQSEPALQADVGAALRLALKRLAPVMARWSVQADLAASISLKVRLRAAVLADLLEEMLAAAIHAAPASRLLLTAQASGRSVAICIIDDLPYADPVVRRASTRDLMRRARMSGGSLAVEVEPDEGTTMTLRLPSAVIGVGAHDPEETLPPATMPASGFAPSINFGMSR